LSEGAFELELNRPYGFQFLPGQRIHLLVGGVGRDYSLVSAPAGPGLALCIRKVTGGRLSSLLAALPPGAKVELAGPLGYFVLRPSSRTPVFVATGTGVAPFVSMARAGATGFCLLHGVRAASDLYYQELFQAAAGHYVACVSGTTGALPPGAFRGRVDRYLAQHLPPAAYDFYLCGRVDMIGDVTRLVDERFPGSRVYTEAYY
jgi:ferredoxin-NADP reductase